MSVSATSSTSGLSAADWQQQFQQVRKDFSTLAKALQSGDLATAQQAYASLQKDMPNNSAAAQTGATSPDSPLAKLGQALNSGDLPGAQQAFAALQQTRHGHHHGGVRAPAAAPAATPAKVPDNDGDSDDNTNQPGAILNVSA